MSEAHARTCKDLGLPSSFPPNSPSGVSLCPHSQAEKPGEALEGLRGKTANPVVGEISRETHTRSAKSVPWWHTGLLARDTQGGWGLCGEWGEKGDGVGVLNVCPQPICFGNGAATGTEEGQ